MTAQAKTSAEPADAGSEAAIGRVARVTGPVVDVEFSAEQMPEIYNALHVDVTLDGETKTLTLEVALHIGDNVVRAISMQQTDGLVRGAVVTDTGAAISVPVGDVTKGHVFNVLGETLDVPTSSLKVTERWGIHREPPPFDELEPKTEMFTTGIKVIDLLTPYVSGGKIGGEPATAGHQRGVFQPPYRAADPLHSRAGGCGFHDRIFQKRGGAPA